MLFLAIIMMLMVNRQTPFCSEASVTVIAFILDHNVEMMWKKKVGYYFVMQTLQNLSRFEYKKWKNKKKSRKLLVAVEKVSMKYLELAIFL